MADSNITKRALASALKELMRTEPFEKINVGDICEKCGMNRKTFYYHFKDKYDLVNWIFDWEYLPISALPPEGSSIQEHYDALLPQLQYFYENRAFYRGALQIKGQNSFSEHLREHMLPVLRLRAQSLLSGIEVNDMTLNFFADGLFCAIARWLGEADSIPPDVFLKRLLEIIVVGSNSLSSRFPQEPDHKEQSS